MTKAINVFLADELPPLHDLLKGEKRDPSRSRRKGKVRQEFVTGEQLNHGTGKWIKKDWCIDKDEKTIRKTITDADTGDLMESYYKPHSDHKGHGSAKFKSKPAKKKGQT